MLKPETDRQTGVAAGCRSSVRQLQHLFKAIQILIKLPSLFHSLLFLYIMQMVCVCRLCVFRVWLHLQHSAGNSQSRLCAGRTEHLSAAAGLFMTVRMKLCQSIFISKHETHSVFSFTCSHTSPSLLSL